MTQTFQCPNCQASLEYDEAGALTVRCSYCGSTVIVPESLRERDAINSGEGVQVGDLAQQVRMTEVAQLIRLGRKIEAIKLLREISGLGLKAAKEAVEKMERGEPVQLTSVTVQRAMQGVQSGAQTVSGDFRKGCLIGVVLLVIAAAGLISFFIISAVAVSEGTEGVAPFMETAESGFAQILPSATPPFAAASVLVAGEEGIGPGFFNDTRAIGVDGEGNIYTGDYDGGRIQVFDADGNFRAQWMLEERETPLLAMAVDREGHLYAVVQGDIYRYDGIGGEPLGLFATSDGAGFRDLAVAPDGTILAYTFMPPDALVWFDEEGNELQRIDEILSSQTGDPEPGALVAADGAGNVYLLAEGFTGVIFKYGADGRFITRIGSQGDGPGQFRSPNSVVVDNQGRIFVDDFDGILVFDNDGRYLDTIPFRGVAFDMVVDDHNNLILMDRNGNRVVLYELAGE